MQKIQFVWISIALIGRGSMGAFAKFMKVPFHWSHFCEAAIRSIDTIFCMDYPEILPKENLSIVIPKKVKWPRKRSRRENHIFPLKRRIFEQISNTFKIE